MKKQTYFSSLNNKTITYLIVGGITALLAGLLSTVSAYYLGQMLNSVDRLFQLAPIFVLTYLFRIAAVFSKQSVFTRLASEVQADLRSNVGHSVAHMSMGGIDHLRTGDMLTRVNSDMEKIYMFYQNRLPRMLQESSTMLFSLILLLWIRWEFAAIVLLGVSAFSFLAIFLNVPLRKAQRTWLDCQSELNVLGNDIIVGHEDIKTMGLQESIAEKYGGAISYWIKIFGRRNNLRATQRGVQTMYAVIVFICIPMLGAYYMLQGIMSIGTIFMSMQAASNLSGPIMDLVYWTMNINEFNVSSERIYELISELPERQGGKAFPVNIESPLVKLSGVSFSYGEGEVVHDVSLEIMPGERIALVGASGSGKSTLLRLIAGLYEASSGRIQFAGHDIDTWDLSAMRRYMAYVQQDTFLFPVSLRENIECGEEIEDLSAVVEGSRLRNWLEKQPDGLEANVGERGSKLSGGLRQRVSIARAMAKKPLLYLFDEPTSALDVGMETEIVTAMNDASEGAASLTVAHRLSSITNSDRIYAMRNGRIVESGSHEQLINAQGYYYTLYVEQGKEAGHIG